MSKRIYTLDTTAFGLSELLATSESNLLSADKARQAARHLRDAAAGLMASWRSDEAKVARREAAKAARKAAKK